MNTFDLNEVPTELILENPSENPNKVQNLDNQYKIRPHSSTFEPFVGQTFLSQEEAFVFYRNYAMYHGFSIRYDRSETKHGKIMRRDFFCRRGRNQPLKVIDPSKEQRNRTSCRCDCNAHMRIKLRKSHEIFPDEWHVTTFIVGHNHELLSPSDMRLLPENRVINTEDEKRILLLKEAGLSVRQIIRVLELEKNINHGELPFFEKDIRNLFSKVRKKVAGNDAMNLVEYFNSCKWENSNFQYVLKVDEERKLEHLFWSPAQCFNWYDKYGDVVVFDTTYKVNSYDMPCGFFVGINNHGKTVLFGCALLRNETTEAFKWLMETFVSTMKKPPKTIITDQDPWMKEAIASELPATKHCFCIWHITSKFSGWFTSILRNQYPHWCADFYRLYKLDTPEDFENQWPLIVGKYNLQDNKHVKGLYEIKHFWVPAYLRGYYFGGMTTTGRSEYINAFIKRFVSSNTTLKDFAIQVDVAVQEIIQTQLHANMLASHKMTILRTKSPLEKQASEVLTPFAFKKFQEEFSRSSQYVVLHESGYDYILRYYEGLNNRSHKVFWDGKLAMCGCKQFEFLGILCRHILRVFLQKDCHMIPSAYLPLRWCLEKGSNGLEVLEEQNLPTHDITLMDNEFIDGADILCPPRSVTKGRPKKRRLKAGKNSIKNTITCSMCRNPGHYVNKCPENKENAIVSNGSQKKKEVVASDLGLNPVFSLKY